MLEHQVEVKLVKAVHAMGGEAYKFSSPARRGVPDRLCVLPGGRVVFVELKRPGKKPTELQLAIHQRMRELGCDVRVWDGTGDVKEMLA